MMNQLKTILLLGALSAVLIAVGGALGRGPMLLMAVVAVAMNIGMYFFSDRMVLRMHRARELGPNEAPRLWAMTDDLARRAGIPTPRLYVIEDPHANAFATGRNPEKGVVAVTTGLMELLDDRQVRGVIAHEIAHIRNRDILVATVAAAIAAIVSYAGQAVMFSGLFGGRSSEDGGNGGGGLLVALVAPLAATLIQLGISRQREYLADATAAGLTGEPEALASALATLQRRAGLIPGHATSATASLFIVSPFAGARGLVHLFSTHPPMEERIARLQAMTGRALGRGR
jgi:heat shock protein HtpX